jgi:hypothetical protein
MEYIFSGLEEEALDISGDELRNNLKGRACCYYYCYYTVQVEPEHPLGSQDCSWGTWVTEGINIHFQLLWKVILAWHEQHCAVVASGCFACIMLPVLPACSFAGILWADVYAAYGFVQWQQLLH